MTSTILPASHNRARSFNLSSGPHQPFASLSTDDQGERFLVVLVHGARITHPNWVREGSTLRNHFDTIFSGKIQFHTFNWSGRNSFHSRFIAAKELARKIGSLAADNPGMPIFLICHSHGGNVALKALDELNKRKSSEKISGIICISTPFLTFNPRTSGTAVEGSPSELARTITALLAWAMGGCLILATRPDNFWLLLATVLGAFVFGKAAGTLFENWITRRIAAFADYASAPVPKSENLLIVRHVGDEASGLLVTATFLSWLTTFLFTKFASNSGKNCRPDSTATTRYISWILPACAACLYLFFDHFTQPEGITSFHFSIAIISIKILLLGGTVLIAARNAHLSRGMMRVLLCLIQSLFALIFGPELFLVAPWIKVSAETTPVGKWRLLLLAHHEGQCNKPPLAHSRPYADERALSNMSRQVEAWLSEFRSRTKKNRPRAQTERPHQSVHDFLG